jgi:hypothetical protein
MHNLKGLTDAESAVTRGIFLLIAINMEQDLEVSYITDFKKGGGEAYQPSLEPFLRFGSP